MRRPSLLATVPSALALTGCLLGLGAGAASAQTFEPPICSDFDTQEEAQDAFDSGDVDGTLLDADGDGVACEADEVPDSAVVSCPPEEVSDLVLLRPGQCGEAADEQVVVVPIGGVDAGAGGAASGDAALLGGGAALVALGAGGLHLARRRRAVV